MMDRSELHEEINSLQADLAAMTRRAEDAERERDVALSALNTERTMREAAQLALTEWEGGIQQGRRIIDAEAYKRLWKESRADNARLREALEFYARDGWTGPCAYPFIPWIMEDKGAKARAALAKPEGAPK